MVKTAFLELEGHFMSNSGDRKFMKSLHCANCNFCKIFFSNLKVELVTLLVFQKQIILVCKFFYQNHFSFTCLFTILASQGPPAPVKQVEPIFHTVPPRPMRLLHSETYIRYIVNIFVSSLFTF